MTIHLYMFGSLMEHTGLSFISCSIVFPNFLFYLPYYPHLLCPASFLGSMSFMTITVIIIFTLRFKKAFADILTQQIYNFIFYLKKKKTLLQLLQNVTRRHRLQEFKQLKKLLSKTNMLYYFRHNFQGNEEKRIS